MRPVLACLADLQFLIAAGSTGIIKMLEGFHLIGMRRLVNLLIQVGVTSLYASIANASRLCRQLRPQNT